MTTDNTRFNHYINTDAILMTTVIPLPSVALCGYVFYPRGFNPRKTLCPRCETAAFDTAD